MVLDPLAHAIRPTPPSRCSGSVRAGAASRTVTPPPRRRCARAPYLRTRRCGPRGNDSAHAVDRSRAALSAGQLAVTSSPPGPASAAARPARALARSASAQPRPRLVPERRHATADLGEAGGPMFRRASLLGAAGSSGPRGRRSVSRSMTRASGDQVVQSAGSASAPEHLLLASRPVSRQLGAAPLSDGSLGCQPPNRIRTSNATPVGGTRSWRGWGSVATLAARPYPPVVRPAPVADRDDEHEHGVLAALSQRQPIAGAKAIGEQRRRSRRRVATTKRDVECGRAATSTGGSARGPHHAQQPRWRRQHGRAPANRLAAGGPARGARPDCPSKPALPTRTGESRGLHPRVRRPVRSVAAAGAVLAENGASRIGVCPRGRCTSRTGCRRPGCRPWTVPARRSRAVRCAGRAVHVWPPRVPERVVPVSAWPAARWPAGPPVAFTRPLWSLVAVKEIIGACGGDAGEPPPPHAARRTAVLRIRTPVPSDPAERRGRDSGRQHAASRRRREAATCTRRRRRVLRHDSR